MLTCSHYEFRMRLTEKARDNPECQVVVVDEAYTSKTCGWMDVCGNIHWKLGGQKVVSLFEFKLWCLT